MERSSREHGRYGFAWAQHTRRKERIGKADADPSFRNPRIGLEIVNPKAGASLWGFLRDNFAGDPARVVEGYPMTRALLILANDDIRAKAIRWIRGLPKDTRLEFKAPKRSLEANAKMWALLTEVSAQLPWHGLRLSADDWKLIFLDALKREIRMVPNIDGNGFVSLGRSSSDLSKEEMADLITLIQEFGARHGVKFHEPERAT
jgi:hypothetical protein